MRASSAIVLRWIAGVFLVVNAIAAGVTTVSAQAGQHGTVVITVVDQHGHAVDGAEFAFSKLGDEVRPEDPADDDGGLDETDSPDLTSDLADDDGGPDLVDSPDLTSDLADDDGGPDLVDSPDLTSDLADDDGGPDLTDSPDLTSDLADDAIDDLPVDDDLGTGDLTTGLSDETQASNPGNVSTLSFAQGDGSNVETYELTPGHYKVNQSLTGSGCDEVDPFRVNVIADQTTEVQVELNCDDAEDDSDGSADEGDGSSDDGEVVTQLPATGNGTDSGLMTNQWLFILLSLVGALGLAVSFGWQVRNTRQ